MLALAVMLGAFGAHALKNQLSDYQLQIYHTGVNYHFIHALGLLILSVIITKSNEDKMKKSFWLLFSGILCFSGSLYLLSITDLVAILPTSILGPITPIGGLLFILGWLLAAVNIGKIQD